MPGRASQPTGQAPGWIAGATGRSVGASVHRGGRRQVARRGRALFAIVDVTARTSRGQILMIVDDQSTATGIAQELNHLAVQVSVQVISPQQLEQLHARARIPVRP